jgi:hypothetical protein
MVAPAARSQHRLAGFSALSLGSPTLPFRMDPYVPGWSWTAGAFSWVEPTAYALLALKKLRAGLPAAQTEKRLQQGERLLYDRMCVDGGWNYGNAHVLGEAVPPFAIVDGIVGMEGNGPIQGTAKPCGVLICGDDAVAVDATAARLKLIDPTKVPYLAQAEQCLGNTSRDKIQQIGERLEQFQQDFRLIPSWQSLKSHDA